jgi:predicted ATP pyrophosphatase (TIGR00289 family)
VRKWKDEVMRVAALISGGKDSMLAAHEVASEHELVALVGVLPSNEYSYMFHSVNLGMLQPIAECISLPLVKIYVTGKEEREVDELSDGLSEKIAELDIEAISIGGIESEYQRRRFEKVCKRCGVKMLSPLWHRNPEELLTKVSNLFETVIVSVSAMGLDESFLGRRIDAEFIKEIKRLNKKYGIHIAGEGGEYETLVLDAPLYKKRIELMETEKVWDGMSGRLLVKKFRLVEKRDFEKFEKM